jgi:hypothetical protein
LPNQPKGSENPPTLRVFLWPIRVNKAPLTI